LSGLFLWEFPLDRQIVYPGAIPLETDLLNTNKNVQAGIGRFIQDALGSSFTGPAFTGLSCVPTTPATMSVVVNPGAVYAFSQTDATAYSSLSADSTPMLKQGMLPSAQTFSTPAPVTSGQSVVYLISAAFLETDTNSTVLPYYNAANPAQAFSGPNNTGASQGTTRACLVALTLTAGVPAATGSQQTPATPAGQTALYSVTVAYGATTVTAANIVKVGSAAFFPGFVRADGVTPFSAVQSGVTPAQFDNSAKLATTAFVQSSLGNFQKRFYITSNTTLTAASSGSYVALGGNGGYTVTLPSPTVENRRFTFFVHALSSCTIATPSASIVNGWTGFSSMTVATGTSLDMVSDGDNWIILSGASAGAIQNNGYQRLPSGLILQWGSFTTSNGVGTATLPVSFPTSQFGGLAGGIGYGGSYTFCVSSLTKTAITVNSYASATGAAASVQIWWLAFGY
jgi:hypothetical protein